MFEVPDNEPEEPGTLHAAISPTSDLQNLPAPSEKSDSVEHDENKGEKHSRKSRGHCESGLLSSDSEGREEFVREPLSELPDVDLIDDETIKRCKEEGEADDSASDSDTDLV